MKVVIVSGGFDPIHSGHISYLESARSMGDRLIVALNSDDWLIKKKGKFFMPFEERKIILSNIKSVDEVISFADDDIGSCKDALEKTKLKFPNDEILFCNGGDRNEGNTLEKEVEGVSFHFGVGGNDKKNSSSWILKNFEYSSEERVWGKFFNLFEDKNLKIKELIISPKSGMSFQRHFHRDEIWFVSRGACVVNFSEKDAATYEAIELKAEQVFHVQKKAWHQITNPFEEPCHIIEIQYGEKTDENDIERLRYYDAKD